jgi:hypothetical protein
MIPCAFQGSTVTPEPKQWVYHETPAGIIKLITPEYTLRKAADFFSRWITRAEIAGVEHPYHQECL